MITCSLSKCNWKIARGKFRLSKWINAFNLTLTYLIVDESSLLLPKLFSLKSKEPSNFHKLLTLSQKFNQLLCLQRHLWKLNKCSVLVFKRDKNIIFCMKTFCPLVQMSEAITRFAKAENSIIESYWTRDISPR